MFESRDILETIRGILETSPSIPLRAVLTDLTERRSTSLTLGVRLCPYKVPHINLVLRIWRNLLLRSDSSTVVAFEARKMPSNRSAESSAFLLHSESTSFAKIRSRFSLTDESSDCSSERSIAVRSRFAATSGNRRSRISRAVCCSSVDRRRLSCRVLAIVGIFATRRSRRRFATNLSHSVCIGVASQSIESSEEDTDSRSVGEISFELEGSGESDPNQDFEVMSETSDEREEFLSNRHLACSSLMSVGKEHEEVDDLLAEHSCFSNV